MTEEVKPATDQEIKEWWQHNCNDRRACNFGQTGPCREQSLFARIEQDRRRLEAAEKLAKALAAMVDCHGGARMRFEKTTKEILEDSKAAMKEWEAAK